MGKICRNTQWGRNNTELKKGEWSLFPTSGKQKPVSGKFSGFPIQIQPWCRVSRSGIKKSLLLNLKDVNNVQRCNKLNGQVLFRFHWLVACSPTMIPNYQLNICYSVCCIWTKLISVFALRCSSLLALFFWNQLMRTLLKYFSSVKTPK